MRRSRSWISSSFLGSPQGHQLFFHASGRPRGCRGEFTDYHSSQVSQLLACSPSRLGLLQETNLSMIAISLVNLPSLQHTSFPWQFVTGSFKPLFPVLPFVNLQLVFTSYPPLKHHSGQRFTHTPSSHRDNGSSTSRQVQGTVPGVT